MAQPLTEKNLDAEVDLALERARETPEVPTILSATYYAEPGMDFLDMRLSDGRRLLVPRQELGELKKATAEQARDLVVLNPGTAIYWPQLDDGLDLMDFLEYRWRREASAVAA